MIKSAKEVSSSQSRTAVTACTLCTKGQLLRRDGVMYNRVDVVVKVVARFVGSNEDGWVGHTGDGTGRSRRCGGRVSVPATLDASGAG
jgi:hypothetical protein